MAQPLGQSPESNRAGRLETAKKKSCKKKKCSNWRGGKCRCGRD